MTTAARIFLTSAAPVRCKRGVPRNHTRPQALKAETKRTHARAVKRIFDKTSGDLVGWLYEWNTGEIVPRWKSEVYDDVFYD